MGEGDERRIEERVVGGPHALIVHVGAPVVEHRQSEARQPMQSARGGGQPDRQPRAPACRQ